MYDYKKNNKIHIGLIDLGLNNINSIYHALNTLNFKVKIINKNIKKNNFDILILPGVGTFNVAMKTLINTGLNDLIFEQKYKKKLIFGICLGMQLMFEKSNEFENTKGLGIFQGNVLKIKKKKTKIVPHIGWNFVYTKNKSFNKLVRNKSMYYFVHSFFCNPKPIYNNITFTKINNFNFCSSIYQDNILATQFHPERSGIEGLKLLNRLREFV